MTPQEPAVATRDGQSPLAVLTEVLDPTRSDWESAWVAMAPAFSDKKTAKLWQRFSSEPASAARYFGHKHLLEMEKALAKGIVKKYRKAHGQRWHLFDLVERQADQRLDTGKGARPEAVFRCGNDADPDHALHMRIDIAPEALAYCLQPVPLRWLYDARFVRFLQELLWDVPLSLGLQPAMAQGGAGFALSAKSYLPGSLLCDDIADRLNHPELACWTLAFPSPKSRCFRATRARRAAFSQLIEQFWAGAFHPRAIGTPRVENAFLDRGFLPASDPPEDLMSKESAVAGPQGSLQEVFQNNFAFGRAVRLLAQNIHPGHWQAAHPGAQGYRPHEIMRHGEAHLSRLLILGEHDDASEVLWDSQRIPEFDAPLEQSFLHPQAAWEQRAQYGRTSAEDYVEAMLLEVHRAQYLQKHPCVQPKASLLQDQLLGDAEETLIRHGGGARLDYLRGRARTQNLNHSQGRIKSDFIEPETLFWEAWHILPAGEQAAIAREVVRHFCERVTQAASCDPRISGISELSGIAELAPESEAHPGSGDPMAWHRHRIHPILWQRIEADAINRTDRDPVLRELRRFREHEELYLSRRPLFDVLDRAPPWVLPWDKRA